jgi:hypothetical protein
MITPAEITTKALRAYLPFLRGWLRGEPFVPLDLHAGAPPADFRALERAVAVLQAGAKEQRGSGYIIEWHTRSTRAYGQQSLPVRIHIPTADDLLALIGKQAEFTHFCDDVTHIRATLPQLEAWLAENPQHVIDQHGAWPELLRVATFFCANPRPNLYLRELPIAVHTKFIEQHVPILTKLLDALLPADAIVSTERSFERRFGLRTDAPLIRIRLLDGSLQTRLGFPFTDFAAPLEQLAELPIAPNRCVIVENKMVFLTLPALPESIAIFGSGFQAELLRDLHWLRTCSIWYWGDLDAQGFQILARLRGLFPHVVSLLMDADVFEEFREFAVAGTATTLLDLPQLTTEEHALYVNLVRSNLRLEQERISHAYAQARLLR